MYISRVTHRRLEDGLPYILIILMAISIVLFQITHNFFINGIDSFFHMSVTYDTYRQLKSGHFSYFLSAFGFYHSLRIVNAVYGPLGGYFSGLLLLITGSWVRWEITSFLIFFTIAGVSMYQLCRYWNVTRVYSILLGCLYMFSFPIMSLWQNSQYDGSGAIFMPWILYFGSMILNGDPFRKWELILLLVILAEIHVFSLLLGLLLLGLCFIMSLIINRGRGSLILRAVKVLFMTAILSFNVWGGIIEVIGSNHDRIIPTYSFSNMFQNVWSSVFYNSKFPASQNLVLLGLSTSILLVIIVVLYLLMIKDLNVQQNFMIIVLGIGFLWLSTRLVPWPLLQKQFPILNTDLQFPKRFLPVSLSAFGVMLGILLTTLQHRMHNHCFGAIVMTVILGMFVIHAWQNTQYQAQALYHQQITASYYGSQFHKETGDNWLTNRRHPIQLANSLQGRHPGSYFRLVTKTTPDYMPSDQIIKSDTQYHHLSPYDEYYQQIVQNRLPYRFNTSGHEIKVTLNRRLAGTVTLPFVKYAHTQVVLNHHRIEPVITKIGAMQVPLKKGVNRLSISYQPSSWFKIGMLISIIAWLGLLLSMVDKGLKLRNKH